MNQSIALSLDEQTTLRRVAHGLTEIDFVRFQDLERLRALRLIDGNVGHPRLTPGGARRFGALPLHLVLRRAATDTDGPVPSTSQHDRRLRR